VEGAAGLDVPKDAEGVAKKHAPTQGSTLSEEGAAAEEGTAGLDVPEDRRARRRRKGGFPHKSHKSNEPARKARAYSRSSKLANLTKTLGPQAAKNALRRDTDEARRAKKKERLDARQAKKQARKARRMIRDQARPNRRGRELFSHPIVHCATFVLSVAKIPSPFCPPALGPFLFLSQHAQKCAAGTGRTRSLGGGFAALHPDFVAKTLPGPVHKTVISTPSGEPPHFASRRIKGEIISTLLFAPAPMCTGASREGPI
jgi:hypothetical protein